MARLHGSLHEYLNDEAIEKLRSVNVNTVWDFLEHDVRKLEKIMKIDRKYILKIRSDFAETFSGKIASGKDLLKLEENVVSTGIASLDELLDGGLHPGELYEFCGLASAGKTQLCLNISINIILETDSIVHYIDTKKDFSGSRAQMILETNGHDDERAARVMKQIKVTRVSNVYALLRILYELTEILEKNNSEKRTRLVVIDSLPSLIISSTENSDSNLFLNHISSVTKYLANRFQISVITNNLINKWRDIDGFASAIIAKPIVVKPNLGKFWLHVPNTRLQIEKLMNERRKVSVWKSFRLKIGTCCTIDLSDAGFV